MKNIRKLYNEAVNTESGIQEHLPVLKSYGESVDLITEFGVQKGYSTSAFLAANPSQLTSFDIKFHPRVQKLVDAASEDEVDFWYILKNVLTATLDYPTDILFIDTKHNYNQLKLELAKFNQRVRQYIMIPYIKKFDYINEVPEGGKREGLVPAVEEFLQQHPDWEKHEEYTNNNGLLILKRNG